MKPPGGIRNILSAVTDAVVLVNPDRKIVFMNPEAEHLTGFSAENAEGKDLWEVCVFIEQKSRKSVTDGISETLLRDGYFNFPIATAIVPRDGAEILIRGNVFLSEEAGSDVIEGVVFRNVSSRWLIDTVMQRNQKAEIIRILAGSISDNLDNLLTVLLARLSGISRNHKNSASVLKSIRDSKKIIGRISSLVSSLSPMAHTGPAATRDVCLVENALKSSYKMFISAYQGKDVTLAYPDRTGFAAVPPGQVEQIVLNLLMNANEAVGGKGYIGITACRVDLQQDMTPVEAGSYVLISVRDEGCGISDENMTRIFDPFYTTSQLKPGLGLSAVYSIVNSFHGYIVVSSEPGKGSMFSVYLPSAQGIVTETAGDINPRVFIAGFKQEEEHLLVRILEGLGTTVVSAEAENMEENSIGEDSKTSDCNLLLADYEFYISETEYFLNSNISEEGTIAVVDKTYSIPDSADSNIMFITRPLSIENIAGAVAECAWSRSAEVMKVDTDEG